MNGRLPAASLLATIALLAGACGSDARLVIDGRPNGIIVLSSSAGADERLAALDLQRYIAKMTGADVPVQAGGTVGAGQTVVRIGLPGGDAIAQFDAALPVADGFTLHTRGDTLWIVGANGRGVLNGVYEYLETDLGVRWYMPGDLGEDVPARAVDFAPARHANARPRLLGGRWLHLGGRTGSEGLGTQGTGARRRTNRVFWSQLGEHHSSDAAEQGRASGMVRVERRSQDEPAVQRAPRRRADHGREGPCILRREPDGRGVLDQPE